MKPFALPCAMLIVLLASALRTSAPEAALFGYDNFWDCILDKMPGVQNDMIAGAVYVECQKKAPEMQVKSQSTRMSPYECMAKYGRNTGGTDATNLVVAACHYIYADR